MRIHLICVGRRMPDWVEAGYKEYVKRLPSNWSLQLTEIPLRKRPKNADTVRLQAEEGRLMLDAIPNDARVVALDAPGKGLSTQQLATRLQDWHDDSITLALLVGGPEGLAPDCKARAHESWSLSKMTFPHPMVRIILAEQIYRASTILSGHPYHR